jgi:hypothetical protein
MRAQLNFPHHWGAVLCALFHPLTFNERGLDDLLWGESMSNSYLKKK